jgi:cysteine desulfuration protein SufE
MAENQKNELSLRSQEVINEFLVLNSWEEKYALLIQKGKSLPILEESFKTEDLKIKGCQSQVWMKSDFENGLVYFKGDSDALLVKGLMALVLQVYSSSTPDQILSTEPDFIKQIGLSENLTPSRSNGLFSMIKQIKFYALAYSLKKN